MNSEVTFASLALAEPILRAIGEAGYTHPTPIQAQAIPEVLSGRDLLAAAQTGTGKTAGFTLPLLQRLMARPAPRDARGRVPVRALILTPTRELAAQVEESVRTYGKYSKLSSMVMFGVTGDLARKKLMPAIYDLANLENSRFIYQTGQSGNAFSSRYSDMARQWRDVSYRPLQLQPTRWQHQLDVLPAATAAPNSPAQPQAAAN